MTHLVVGAFIVSQPVLELLVQSGDLLHGAFFGGYFGHFVFQPTSLDAGAREGGLNDGKALFPRRLLVDCVMMLLLATSTARGGREVDADETDIVAREVFATERTDRLEAWQCLFYDFMAAA